MGKRKKNKVIFDKSKRTVIEKRKVYVIPSASFQLVLNNMHIKFRNQVILEIGNGKSK